MTRSVGKSSLADRLERLVERERDRARTGLEEVPPAIGVGRQHEEPARALERGRLRADVDVRVAELVRRRAELRQASWSGSSAGSGRPRRSHSSIVRRLVVAGRDRLGRGHQHGHVELVEPSATPPPPRTMRAGRPRRRPRAARAQPGARETRPTSRAARRGRRRRSPARRGGRSCRCRPRRARARRSAGATSRAAPPPGEPGGRHEDAQRPWTLLDVARGEPLSC